jgi:hypothetical protein
MNLKLRLKMIDIFKLFFGRSCLVRDPYNGLIYRVQKGKQTYITKA